MKPRKIIIDIGVILFAFILFVIWYQNTIEKRSQMTFSKLKYYEVYLITTDKEYEFWNIMNTGAADMARDIGINYIWDAPQERNVDQQIEIINRAVEAGAEALLIAADDPKRISAVVEDAKARGVKVIYVDSPAYEEAITTLSTDNYEAGVRAGETLIEILNERGISSGSVGIIGYASKENTDLRDMGFRSVLEEDGRFRVLDTIETKRGDPDEAQEAAERLIRENEDLVALYGTNEGTSIGVGNAIRANNNRYIGIGFDRTDIMLELLEDGNLQAIVVQNPYTMGYLGMAEAVAAILGKNTGPDYINTGVSVIRNEQER